MNLTPPSPMQVISDDTQRVAQLVGKVVKHDVSEREIQLARAALILYLHTHQTSLPNRDVRSIQHLLEGLSYFCI